MVCRSNLAPQPSLCVCVAPHSRVLASLQVPAQTWKKTIAGKGSADKGEVKKAIEKQTSFHFPANLFIRGRWLKFRSDASDATAIALHGVRQVYEGISLAEPLIVEAPGLPKPRPGKVLEVPPLEVAAPVLAPIAAVEEAVDSPPLPERVLHDPFACTLVPGCTLPCNHTGLCQLCEVDEERAPRRVDYAALARRGAKRPRALPQADGEGGRGWEAEGGRGGRGGGP